MRCQLSNVDRVDRRNLRITGKHRTIAAPHVAIENDVLVVVTQAFGPQGHNLVGISDVEFDGHPAVTLKLRAGGREGRYICPRSTAMIAKPV